MHVLGSKFLCQTVCIPHIHAAHLAGTPVDVEADSGNVQGELAES